MRVPKLDYVLSAWAKRRREGSGIRPLEDLSAMRSAALRADQLDRMGEADLQTSDEFDAVLTRLGLDTRDAPLPPTTRVDLFLHCQECDRRANCRHWLAGTGNPLGYRQFCPNAPMFERLLCIRRRRGVDSP